MSLGLWGDLAVSLFDGCCLSSGVGPNVYRIWLAQVGMKKIDIQGGREVSWIIQKAFV